MPLDAAGVMLVVDIGLNVKLRVSSVTVAPHIGVLAVLVAVSVPRAPVATAVDVPTLATDTAVPAVAFEAVVEPDTPVTDVVASFDVAPGYDLTNVSVLASPRPVIAEPDVATPTAAPEAEAVRYLVVEDVLGTVAVTVDLRTSAVV